MTRAFEAEPHPDLDVVWEWFEIQAQLIAGERGRYRLVFQGRMSAERLDSTLYRRFDGLTHAEVEESFENQRWELELLTMFGMLAATEAILRLDFDRRVKCRLKDSLSRRYRAIARRTDRTRLDEDLLQALHQEAPQSFVVGEFRSALRLRHWLAHGRHWHPKLGRRFTPAVVFEISRKLVDTLP